MSEQVGSGTLVTLHYRLATADDTELVSTFDGTPATLQMGSGELAPPLERCVVGLAVGERHVFLLAPDQAFFLRENLKLRLLNARLALMSRQFDIAQADLREAQTVLDRYFDRNSKRVVATSEQLRTVALQARQIGVPRPEATLAALAAAVAGR